MSIDLTNVPAHFPSVCIPRVFSNIDEKRIRKIFDSLCIGEIDRVDIVQKTTEKGEKYNRVFIHWRYWNASDMANLSRQRLLNGKEIKVMYDDPWFWKVSAYREPLQRPQIHKPVRLQEQPRPRIMFENDNYILPIAPGLNEDHRRPPQPQNQNQNQDRRRPPQNQNQEDRRPPQNQDRRRPPQNQNQNQDRRRPPQNQNQNREDRRPPMQQQQQQKKVPITIQEEEEEDKSFKEIQDKEMAAIQEEFAAIQEEVIAATATHEIKIPPLPKKLQKLKDTQKQFSRK